MREFIVIHLDSISLVMAVVLFAIALKTVTYAMGTKYEIFYTYGLGLVCIIGLNTIMSTIIQWFLK